MKVISILCIFSVCFLVLCTVFYLKNTIHTQRRITETFEESVTDFDVVMDSRCVIETNGSKNDYVFGKAYCRSDTCPNETCHVFNPTDVDGQPRGWNTVESAKCNTMNDDELQCHDGTSVQTHNCDVIPITKKAELTSVLCNEPKPICLNIGEKKTIYEYEDEDLKKEWVKKTFQKDWTDKGECTWIQDDDNNNYMTDFEINNAPKEPVDCSVSNILCSQQISYRLTDLNNGRVPSYDPRTNVMEYEIDPDDPTGLTCKPTNSNACNGCESDTKIGYKLNTVENKYEPRIYTKRVIGNLCTYYDNQGFCCPTSVCDSVNAVPSTTLSNYCSFEAASSLFRTDDMGKTCLDLEPRFCSNLDNRDHFTKTKFIPRLKSDGTGCEYRSANLEDSRILKYDLDSHDGFECWDDETQRLCKNEDEFRNSALGKCTKCPNKKFLTDRTSFSEDDACVPIADCTREFDTCFVPLSANDSSKGEVSEKVLFEKRNDPENLAQCISHPDVPRDCVSECLTNEKYGFCYECFGGVDKVDFDSGTKSCRKLPDNSCDGEGLPIKKCLNDHDYLFYEYRIRHSNNDRFNPECEYYRDVVVDLSVEEETTYPSVLTECTETCPPNFIRSGDACTFPRCEGVVEYSVELGGDYKQLGVLPTDDQTEMSNIYHNLELGAYPTFSNGVCKYTEATRTERIKLPDTQPACFMDDNTQFLLKGTTGKLDKHSFETRVIYDHDTPSNVTVKKSLGNECDEDCEFTNNVFTNTFTNKPGKYIHTTTEKYTIQEIEKEATGKGEPCNASGGFVVKGNTLNKDPTPPEFVRFLPNNSQPEFDISDTQSYLLKERKFIVPPPAVGCGDPDVSTISGQTRYKVNSGSGYLFNCSKEIKVSKKYPIGRKSVIHTANGGYVVNDCGQNELATDLWTDTADKTTTCPECKVKHKTYIVSDSRVIDTNSPRFADSGSAQLHISKQTEPKNLTLRTQYQRSGSERCSLPTDANEDLMQFDQLLTPAPPRTAPSCKEWGVYGVDDVQVGNNFLTSNLAMDWVRATRPGTLHCRSRNARFNIKCKDKRLCISEDATSPYKHICGDVGIPMTISSSYQCPAEIGDDCSPLQPCPTSPMSVCVNTSPTSESGVCQQCGSPGDCIIHNLGGVCGADKNCYYECDPTTNDLTTGTNETCTYRDVVRTYYDDEYGTAVVTNTAPYCSPIGWCTDCLSTKTQCENQTDLKGCYNSVCSYGVDYLD